MRTTRGSEEQTTSNGGGTLIQAFMRVSHPLNEEEGQVDRDMPKERSEAYKAQSEFNRMVDFLDTAWLARDEIVPCLIGPPGIGKTQAVYKHAEKVGAESVVTIIASQILPNEVSGITMPDPQTKAMEIYDHYRLGHLKDGDILFFDELLEADQMVLSACLTLIESRRLMSGRHLPDIQIIAASNPSILPVALKENIRQRFMFERFHIDKNGTAEYLWDTMQLRLRPQVLTRMTDTGSNYNILTPRSLTKLCKWMDATPDDKLEMVAWQMNNMWEDQLGTEIMNAVVEKRSSAENFVRTALFNITQECMGGERFNDYVREHEEFEDAKVDDLVELLQQEPEWERIAEQLASIDMPDDDKRKEFV